MKFVSAILLGVIAMSDISAIRLAEEPEPSSGKEPADTDNQSEYIKRRAANLDTMKKENAWTNGDKVIAGKGKPAPVQTDGTIPMDEKRARPNLKAPHKDGVVDVPEAKLYLPKGQKEKKFVPPRVGKPMPVDPVI